MSENALRAAVEADRPAFGARAATFAPEVVEVYGDLGLDFVWLDFEHTGRSPYDSRTFEHLTRAADAADVELLVRVPSGDPPLVRKVLDAGVRNLIVPRVETVDDVRPAVEAAHFEYDGGVGDRGVAGGRSSGWGGRMEDYTEREDGSVLVGTMIENRTAVDNLGDILSVPDLGFAFVGPNDLSVSLGHPLETDHPEVRETVETVREACLAHDVPVGRIAADAGDAAAAVDEGFRILRIGGELDSARAVLGERVDDLDHLR